MKPLQEEGRESELLVLRLRGQIDKQQALLNQLESLKSQEVQQYIEGHERKGRQVEEQQSQLAGYKQQVISLSQELEQLRSSRKEEGQKQNSDWVVEKSYLQNQVKFLQGQMEENKSRNQELMSALGSGQQQKESQELERVRETVKGQEE